jgi:hypothetical protein
MLEDVPMSGGAVLPSPRGIFDIFAMYLNFVIIKIMSIMSGKVHSTAIRQPRSVIRAPHIPGKARHKYN